MSPSPWSEPLSAERGERALEGAAASRRGGRARRPPARLVVVPGLRGSGEAHWQTWLERQFDGAVRVEQDDWNAPGLERWSARVVETIESLGPGPHVVAAHSFGCLATVHALARRPAVAQVLLVAPAEPARFDLAARLPQARLAVPSCVVASDTDPWMSAASARDWARRWGSEWINLGDAGHVNVASGFGPFPLARDWTSAALRRLASEDRAWGYDERPWRIAA